MSYELSWYVDKRVLGVRLEGELTLEEIISNTPLFDQYLPESVAPLFIIVDARFVTKFPTELSSLVQGIKEAGDYNGKFERTAIVSDSRVLNFLSTMGSIVFKTPIRSVKTIEEAEAYLAQYAPDLAPAFAQLHSQ